MLREPQTNKCVSWCHFTKEKQAFYDFIVCLSRDCEQFHPTRPSKRLDTLWQGHMLLTWPSQQKATTLEISGRGQLEEQKDGCRILTNSFRYLGRVSTKKTYDIKNNHKFKKHWYTVATSHLHKAENDAQWCWHRIEFIVTLCCF